jgi:hypothetical protein
VAGLAGWRPPARWGWAAAIVVVAVAWAWALANRATIAG